jgi:hypothetical protein
MPQESVSSTVISYEEVRMSECYRVDQELPWLAHANGVYRISNSGLKEQDSTHPIRATSHNI